jgi:hypothetical protein
MTAEEFAEKHGNDVPLAWSWTPENELVRLTRLDGAYALKVGDSLTPVPPDANLARCVAEAIDPLIAAAYDIEGPVSDEDAGDAWAEMMVRVHPALEEVQL